ncbi:hypothetical protein [Pseudonocardia alaniniphila]|uniref:hypothetical protein n=1 Tax=Pseudonocardia alaniniphila TaxID=75291 RepID=UPI0036352BD2
MHGLHTPVGRGLDGHGAALRHRHLHRAEVHDAARVGRLRVEVVAVVRAYARRHVVNVVDAVLALVEGERPTAARLVESLLGGDGQPVPARH